MKVSNYSPKEKYSWRAKGMLFVFVLSALYSCVSLKKIGIQVSVLPEYPLAEDIQSIVVLNRSMTNKFTNIKSDTLIDSKLSVDSVFQDSLATDTAIQVAAKALFESGRFDVVIPKERNIVRNDSEKIANPLNADYVNEMCRDFNVDAVLVLESFYELLKTKYYWANQNDMEWYSATTDLSYLSEWRLYRPNDLKPVIRFQSEDSIFWRAENSSLKSTYAQMPEINDALTGGGIAAGLKVAEYISPHWVDQIRYYYSTGKPEIDAAILLIQNNKWEDAAVIWSKYAEINSKTIKSKVEFNLALAAEMNGDIDLATEWGLKSFKTRYTKVSEDYIKLLDNKIKEQQTESKKEILKMIEIFYYAILFVLIANFIFERWLDYLNTTNWSSELPPELSGIYDEEKYRKSQEYEKATYRFTLITESLGFVAVLLIFASGGFGWLDGIIRSKLTNPIHIALVFFAILGLITEIGSLPFSWYFTFIIEEKFGFNKSTPRLFFFDQLKGLVMGAVIGGILLYLIVWIYLIAGTLFWVYALLVIAIFSIFMLLFYSNLIVPLFNKQTLLEEGVLKMAIREFSNKAGFLLDNVFVIDGSKRSTKANAYFTGLGRKKRIVLYDTLISEMKTEEIVAVLAHEIGHYKKHHVLSGLFFSLLTTSLMLYLFSIVGRYPIFAQALGSEVPSFHLAVISFGILYSPLSMVLGLGMNYISRKNEYQADKFAAENYKGEYLASALKKLSINNLSNLTPHPVYVFFHYSHPTLLQRLKKLMVNSGEKELNNVIIGKDL